MHNLLLLVVPGGTLAVAAYFLFLNKENGTRHIPRNDHHAKLLGARLQVVEQEIRVDGDTTMGGWFRETRYLPFYHARILGLWFCVVTSLGLLTLPIIHAFAQGVLAAGLVTGIGTTVMVATYRRFGTLHAHVFLVLGLMIAGATLGGMPSESHPAVYTALLNNVPMLYIAFARNADRTVSEDQKLFVATIIWIVGHGVSLIMLMAQLNIHLTLSWSFLSYPKQISAVAGALALLVITYVFRQNRGYGNREMVETVSEAASAEESSSSSLPYLTDPKERLDLGFDAQQTYHHY